MARRREGAASRGGGGKGIRILKGGGGISRQGSWEERIGIQLDNKEARRLRGEGWWSRKDK